MPLSLLPIVPAASPKTAPLWEGCWNNWWRKARNDAAPGGFPLEAAAFCIVGGGRSLERTALLCRVPCIREICREYTRPLTASWRLPSRCKQRRRSHRRSGVQFSRFVQGTFPSEQGADGLRTTRATGLRSGDRALEYRQGTLTGWSRPQARCFQSRHSIGPVRGAAPPHDNVSPMARLLGRPACSIAAQCLPRDTTNFAPAQLPRNRRIA